jgi:hypothetical protein
MLFGLTSACAQPAACRRARAVATAPPSRRTVSGGSGRPVEAMAAASVGAATYSVATHGLGPTAPTHASTIRAA